MKRGEKYPEWEGEKVGRGGGESEKYCCNLTRQQNKKLTTRYRTWTALNAPRLCPCPSTRHGRFVHDRPTLRTGSLSLVSPLLRSLSSLLPSREHHLVGFRALHILYYGVFIGRTSD